MIEKSTFIATDVSLVGIQFNFSHGCVAAQRPLNRSLCFAQQRFLSLYGNHEFNSNNTTIDHWIQCNMHHVTRLIVSCAAWYLIKMKQNNRAVIIVIISIYVASCGMCYTLDPTR